MSDEIILKFEKTINASADLIYRAFTSASALREWLCDVSITNPSEGGWIYLAWYRGYSAHGHFTKLVPNQAVSFSWIGEGEPDWSRVDISINPIDGQNTYSVVVEHSGIGKEPEWADSHKEISRGWEKSLENLKVTLEKGYDLRVVERPLIGIFPMDLPQFSDTEKDSVNIPVDYGVLVSNVVPDYGADKAGIKAGDVIVAIDGKKVDRITTMASMIDNYSPGDKIKIDIFRGTEKQSFVIDTTPQLILTPPDTPEELAKEIEKDSTKILTSLEKVLTGVSEAEASYSPESEKLSVKETIAHLILHERDLQAWINDLVYDNEGCSFEMPDHCLIRLRAMLMTYPTLDDLVGEFRRSLKETVATVAFLDSSVTRRKASYWRVGFELLEKIIPYLEYIQHLDDLIQEARRVISG